ncbi:hypothetical protein ACLQ29_31235 [Micromonospora sp. DT228]|uniref:hypothetical protein n=1 Tax=Micromonospora sp. DT228 TaxID=3393443 RepID=UPI003CEC4E63
MAASIRAAAAGVAEQALGVRPETAARPIQLTIGISFIGEALAVTRRGIDLRVPFAPVRR